MADTNRKAGGKVGVLIIHGMGMQKKDFAGRLIFDLQRRLGNDADSVVFESCWWGSKLNRHQRHVWDRIDKRYLNAQFLRNLVVDFLSDPVMYLSGYFKKDKPVYSAIHRCVSETLTKIKKKLEDPDNAPLVILAHSLGSVIISNYVWDEQHRKPDSADELYEGTRTLTKLITYGSNIPLFLPPTEPIEAITFPHKQIPKHLRDKAKWTNIYDPDDILGYPLNGLWKDSDKLNLEDRAMHVGPLVLSATPLSHVCYEMSFRFQRIVVGEIGEVMEDM